MQNLQINLPDFVEIDTQEATLLLALRLYERGSLSIGQAAEMAKLSKRSFMEIMGRYGVSPYNYGVEDLDGDFSRA